MSTDTYHVADRPGGTIREVITPDGVPGIEIRFEGKDHAHIEVLTEPSPERVCAYTRLGRDWDEASVKRMAK